MTCSRTIPFPEGLDGDYSSPCDGQAGERPAPDRRGPRDCVLDARAALHSAEASRAFRESLARCCSPGSAANDAGAEAPILHSVDFTRIAA
jgi:hypothetical protein